MDKILLSFLIFIFSSILFAQPEREIDSLLFSIKEIHRDTYKEYYNKLSPLIFHNNPVESKRICEKALNYLSQFKDKSLYIRLYLDTQSFYPFEEKIKIFDHAYKMASDEKNEDLMGIADMMKGFAYRDNTRTDSAMVCILRAKTIFEKNGNLVDLVHTLLVIADLHYWAGQYEKAEILYHDIMEKKGDPGGWVGWIHSVVLNDLGLIKIKQGKFDDAENYFLESLDQVLSRKLYRSDSMRLSYIYRKLSETNILLKKYSKAEEYYDSAYKYAVLFDQKSELIGLYINHGKILQAKGNYNLALDYFKKAEMLEKDYPDISDRVSVYEGLTKTYNSINDIKNSYLYLSLLRDTENLSDSLFYRAKYMTLYAENNYDKYLNEIADYRLKQIVMISFIALILLSLTVITYYYLKLRKANQKMVQKNLEVVLTCQDAKIPAHIIEKEHLDKKDITEDNGVDENTISHIQNELENIMTRNKLYLDSDVTLDNIANRLKTNRAYLSKTINIKYRMNFNTYINTLRIKEAIKSISFGEHKIYNIEGIAQKVGFNNRVSFNKAFLKYTGVTPSFFIRNADSNI